MVELVLALLGGEFLDDGVPGGVGHVLGDLAAKGAVAEGREALLEGLEGAVMAEIRELFAEALEVAEGLIVDE